MISATGNALVLINGKAKYAKQHGAQALKQRLENHIAQHLQATLQAQQRRVHVLVTDTIQALHHALEQHPPGTLDMVVPVGGDGTLNTVLNALWAKHGQHQSSHTTPAPLPAILAVHAGTMNQVANDITPPRCPMQAILQALQCWAQAGLQAQDQTKAQGQAKPQGPLTTPRYALCINHTHLGFAFGYGASAEFLHAYNAQGAGIGVAWRLLAQYAWQALRGRPQLPKQLGLALTVRKLPLGVRLSTSGGPQAQPQFCWVHGHKVNWGRLALALPWVWFGRLPANTGLQRSTQQRVCIQENQAQPWHLDGDLHPPCSQFDIALGPKVQFVLLP